MPTRAGESAIVRSIVATGALAAALLASFATARAEVTDSSYPSRYPRKPVRMLVPLAPGGGSDIVGRIIALALTEQWAQSVVVDNRPGAGSSIGTAIAARAAPDGYTMLVSSSSIAITPALFKNLDFDVLKDFTAITLIATQPSILAVHPSVAANSVKELIALLKSQPGRFRYGSAGPGSASHLANELFCIMAGLSVTHLPYRSAGLAATALLSGEVQLMVTNMATALPQVRAGRMKGLGVTGLKRSPQAPDLPTVAEAGLAGYEYSTWYGMLAPVATPRAIVEKVHHDLVKSVRAPQLQERFSAQGLDVLATAPAEFAAYLKEEIARWGKVVKVAGVRAE